MIAESVRAGWQSVIGRLICDPCLQHQWVEQYRQGRGSQIANVEQSDLASCYVEFLTQLQVKANLVAPIVVRSPVPAQGEIEPHLWGLLIVQQCNAPRTWDSLEVQVLKQLALHIAIAIAHLTAQTQWQADLQQRLVAEAQLRQSEAHLRQLIDQSPVVIMTFAPDGTFRTANPAWETLWQTPQAELVRFNPFHDPQLIAAGQRPFWQRALAGEAVTCPPMYYDPALSGRQGCPAMA